MAYVEAITLYEEARDMFVQVYFTIAVFNTVVAAVGSAAAVVLLCQVLQQGVSQTSPSASNRA